MENQENIKNAELPAELKPFSDGGLDRVGDLLLMAPEAFAFHFRMMPYDDRLQIGADILEAARRYVENCKAIDELLGDVNEP